MAKSEPAERETNEIAAEAAKHEHGEHGEQGGGSDCGSTRKSHHSDKVKSSLISRLNRIEGQVRGIKGLIEKDTYCDDVLHQIASVQAALNGVGKLLLEHHMKSCVIERIQEGDEDVVSELMTTIQKLMK
mgnify:CR=1 FL=1